MTAVARQLRGATLLSVQRRTLYRRYEVSPRSCTLITMMSTEDRSDQEFGPPAQVEKMNDTTAQQDGRMNISSSAVSPLGSALIFLQGTMQEDPWLYNQKNKTSGGSSGIKLHVDPNNPWGNGTSDGVEAHSLPGFGDNARAVVAVYCVLFSVAAIGNLSVFLTLLRARHRKSRPVKNLGTPGPWGLSGYSSAERDLVLSDGPCQHRIHECHSATCRAWTVIAYTV
ncbi:hypothetical protein ANN_11276 [Periplaneta americana]|uniref:Uncharacterized protein n=1 Tax=Periplaneta americana TaxID=6978 RepID=A0ABQ8T5Z3_PERAM|nr:hypothetical protein ANN_11276 [Periplaneta americana]